MRVLDANRAWLNPTIVRRLLNGIKEPVAAFMSVEQLVAWENCGIKVSQVLSQEGVPHGLEDQLRPTMMAGHPILTNVEIPRDVIRFVGFDGIVAEIKNLRFPE